MEKVHESEKYDFYLGFSKDPQGFVSKLYNIVPKCSNKPEGGYPNMSYIENIKGEQFPDRFQPPKNGLKNYPYYNYYDSNQN